MLDGLISEGGEEEKDRKDEKEGEVSQVSDCSPYLCALSSDSINSLILSQPGEGRQATHVNWSYSLHTTH